MAPQKRAMLHINDLTYRIGERLSIDHATVALPTGARVGLVGRNGAGKTTLFRLIAGEIGRRPAASPCPKAAHIGQRRTGGAGRERKRLIDFVLEADVERNTAHGRGRDGRRPAAHRRNPDPPRRHRRPCRARARGRASSPASASTKPAQNRALSEFSGGWRMRVALAAVLFSQPDLLLLDEPTNYLDLEGVLWLVDYLKTYPATILVISHDRDLLDDVVDHILHLERGKLDAVERRLFQLRAPARASRPPCRARR